MKTPRKLFGSVRTDWGASKKVMPSLRNFSHEKSLCEAISKRLCVELRYEDDLSARTYEPHAVYLAGTDNVLVTGLQTNNPNKPLNPSDIHNFTVGKIVAVSITRFKIAPDARVDRTDDRFKHGIICSI